MQPAGSIPSPLKDFPSSPCRPSRSHHLPWPAYLFVLREPRHLPRSVECRKRRPSNSFFCREKSSKALPFGRCFRARAARRRVTRASGGLFFLFASVAGQGSGGRNRSPLLFLTCFCLLTAGVPLQALVPYRTITLLKDPHWIDVSAATSTLAPLCEALWIDIEIGVRSSLFLLLGHEFTLFFALERADSRLLLSLDASGFSIA